jgi:hypothetical protein
MPKLVSVSPNVGSIGGSLIIARLEGLGPLNDTSQEYWNAHGGTLYNTVTGDDICKNVIVTSYGDVECITLPGVIDAGTPIGARSFESDVSLECSNSDPTLCQYEQLESDTYPVITSIDNSVSN